MPQSDRSAMQASAGDRLKLIAASFARLAGRSLVEPSPGGLELALWNAPRAIVAHGTEPEPRFFYGNRVALELFAMTAGEFIDLPSHRSAEPALRLERARMLEGLVQCGIVEDYAGVRIAATGRRFAISHAQVWNLADELGDYYGQAATFAEWRFLD
ncbi:MAG TPA: MEKHLA domain-containing protein [Croceibacterium sp.]